MKGFSWFFESLLANVNMQWPILFISFKTHIVISYLMLYDSVNNATNKPRNKVTRILT